MPKTKKKFIIWTVIITLISLIVITTQFSTRAQWNESMAYSLILLFIGGSYESWRWLKTCNRIYRLAFSMGLLGILLLGWVSGAVGIIGSENNSVNLMYWAIPVVWIIGSFVSRFKPRGMAFTLSATAIIQFLIPVVALIISSEVSWGNAGVIGVFIVNTFFAILFASSGLLFLRATRKYNESLNK